MIVLLAVLAGGLGAAARFVVDGTLKSRVGDEYPWATLVINVIGALLLGVLTGLALHQGMADEVRVILGTGFCGGYTTFSTASFETVRLVQRGTHVAALAYSTGTIALTVAAGGIGLVSTL